MTVTVRLFAVLRDLAQTDSQVLDVPNGSTVGAAAAILAERHPALGAWMGRVVYAVNLEYVLAGRVLVDGDELALIPPVSGG